jgi:glycine hydroxymethyltransferase
VTSGVRIGTPAITRRGFKEAGVHPVGQLDLRRLDSHDNEEVLATVREKVLDICRRFPVYA